MKPEISIQQIPMKTKQLTYPTIQEQQQYWKDKEALDNQKPVSDNATNETCLVQLLAQACRLALESPIDENTVNKLEEALAQYDAYYPQYEVSTTADPKPGNLSRTEATAQWFDGLADTYWSLRDEGRNDDGTGESYAERNV